MRRQILAVGLSPAWQQIVQLDRLTLGEVNRARDVTWCASGKVINVGMALHRLGATARLLTVIGGWSGREIQNEISALNLPAHWIETNQLTRICTTVLDVDQQQTTELVENASAISTAEIDHLIDCYREQVQHCDVVVGSGSLPHGVRSSLFRELLELRPVDAVLDIRGSDLSAALACRPFVVKPNRAELEQTLGRSLNSQAELVEGMRELVSRGAQWVVITDGPRPTLIVNVDYAWQIHPVSVRVVNPIGCGDCVAAGIAAGIADGLSVPEAARLGLGAAAQNATMLLPARVTREAAEEFAARCVLEKL